MSVYDVHVEFVNGQTTWHTVEARDKAVAEGIVSDLYWDHGTEPWSITAHPWGTRPGYRRQPRKS